MNKLIDQNLWHQQFYSQSHTKKLKNEWKKKDLFFSTTLQYLKKCSGDSHRIYEGNEVWSKNRIEHNSSSKKSLIIWEQIGQTILKI